MGRKESRSQEKKKSTEKKKMCGGGARQEDALSVVSKGRLKEGDPPVVCLVNFKRKRQFTYNIPGKKAVSIPTPHGSLGARGPNPNPNPNPNHYRLPVSCCVVSWVGSCPLCVLCSCSYVLCSCSCQRALQSDLSVSKFSLFI